MKQAARSAAGPTSIIRYHDINQIRAWDYRLGREKNQRNAPSDDAEAPNAILYVSDVILVRTAVKYEF